MAFSGGMRRAVNGAALSIAFAGAGAASFYYFEDFYRVIERNWPELAVSVEPASDDPQTVSSTAPVVPAQWQSSPASLTAPAAAPEPVEMRASLTDLTTTTPTNEKSARSGRSVTLMANAYGHFIVEAEINGAKAELLTDTGATYVALNYQTALQIGFTPQTLNFTSRSTTANGIARVAPVTLEYLRIGSIVLRDVKAVVAEPGKMTQNLLGMSFINRLGGFELSGGKLVMLQKQ